MKLKALGEAGKVGHFACAVGSGRLVRCAMAEPMKRPPKSARVRCPACGNEHVVALMWRQPLPRDEGREVEVVIPVPEAEEK